MGVILSLSLVVLSETAGSARAGWGRWRRSNRAYSRGYAMPAASYRYPIAAASYPARAPIPPSYPYRFDRFYGGNSFGNGPVLGNYGNYNPSFGIGPGTFIAPR
jgi:hypothetical protein